MSWFLVIHMNVLHDTTLNAEKIVYKLYRDQQRKFL